MYVSPKSRWSVSSRFTTCARIDTSSADTGSSRMISCGFNASARATPMRWRWPPENSCGNLFPCSGDRPTMRSNSSTRCLPAPARVLAVDAQRLADDVVHRHPRIQRRIRILEDDLHLAAHVAHLTPVQMGDVPPVEDDRPGGRLDELDQRPGERRLATAGLTDEAERLPRLDREIDAVDGMDLADGALQEAGADREVLDEPFDLEDLLAHEGHRADRLRELRAATDELLGEVARRQMVVAGIRLPQLRHLFTAAQPPLREEAARMKRAAGRTVDERRAAGRGSAAATPRPPSASAANP